MLIKERWTNEIDVENFHDENGNPAGGSVHGRGLHINWQNGPIFFDFETGKQLEENNGAFTEDLILATIQRIKFFQESNEGKFKCRENSCAITHLEEALMWLQRRHDDRVNRKVQGQHKP